MARNHLGDLRRSQVITIHGPGAIVDFRSGGAGISVVAAGLDQWDERAAPAGLAHPQTISEPRLEKELGVDGFRLPPVARQTRPGEFAKDAGSLVGARFPTWLQCPNCHLLRPAHKWTANPGDPALQCATCSRPKDPSHVVPARFVVACPYGHLNDFPWHYWLGGHAESCTRKGDLKLEGGATAGLAGYVLSCTECGNRRSMEGCFGTEWLQAIPCEGRRPWLAAEPEECPTTKPGHKRGSADLPSVLQRGASNLYFSVLESAIDIPPWSEALQKRLGIYWSKLVKADDAKLKRLIEDLELDALTEMPTDKLLVEIKKRRARLESPERNLRLEEYEQLTRHEKPHETQEFAIRPAEPPRELQRWLGKVVQVTRLREVRALYGFTRIQPPLGRKDKRLAKIAASPKNWLPAVENRGEGIFLALNREALNRWESLENVRARAALRHAAYAADWKRRGGEGPPPRTISARFLLLHGLAHALIRQLSLDCGYSSASLRERLYADTGTFDMAGLLVFTASPDADGTLGGLVRQGEPESIVRLLENGLAAMSWCSSDPLCIEGIHTLTDPLSGAACHACLLAAETSCEEFNRLLDRALLVGTPKDPSLGFFHELVASTAED